MKSILYEDNTGMLHRSLLPDDVPETQALTGLLQDPPPFLELLNWEGMGRTLWNLMVEYGVRDWETHQANPGALNAAIKGAIMNPLIQLLKTETRDFIISKNGKLKE